MKKIVIAGGGSSGWMTAAALSKHLPNAEITLIESKNIGIIGVGESTLPRINHYLNLIGVKDEEWMHKCDAIYKLAIKYSNFLHEGSYYYDVLREFSRPSFNNAGDKVEIMDFLILNNIDPEIKLTEFSRFFDDTYDMVTDNKYTDSNEVFDWNPKWDKAYHLDAYKFGLALKESVAQPNGVIHIEDDIVGSGESDDGIEYLQTKNNGKFYADLFIDCTGFKGLLIGEKLGVKFDKFENFMNDRAWAANIPYEDKDRELQSYTNCTTLENGWLWNIPIWSRIGTGYVYSSKFVDDETALKQYKDGLRKTYGKRADEIEARPIKFNSGVREKPWHKNVVSIGLSCGFLEPLNSTGLMMTHDNVIRLVTLLSMKNFEINQIDKDIFNKNCREQILSMKDFILTRYALARRNDTPYWKHVTQNLHYDNGDSVVFSDFGKIIRDYYYDENNPQYNNFNQKVLTGMNYNPVPKIITEIGVRTGQINMNRLNEIKSWWLNRKFALKNYTNSLPTQNEYLKNRIYNEKHL